MIDQIRERSGWSPHRGYQDWRNAHRPYLIIRNKMGQVTVASRALPEEQPEHLTLTGLYA